MPGLVLAADVTAAAGVHGVEEFLGQVRLEPGVVVAQARCEGPFVPTDLVLGEQAVGVDGRVREIAGFCQHVPGADGAYRGATDADRQAHAIAAARAGDFLLLEGGAVSQRVIGVGDAEGLFQLRVEDPLFLFIEGLPGAQDPAGDGEVEFGGALVGLGDLVIQAPLHVIGQQAVEGEAVLQAETLAGDGVVAGAPLVHAAGQHRGGDGRLTVGVGAAVGAFQVAVAVVLVFLVDQAKA